MEQIENKNAKDFKRIPAFFVDVVIINFLITFITNTIIFTNKRIEQLNDLVNDFNSLFGKFNMLNIKEEHIRFIVNSKVFDYFIYIILTMFFCAIMYNFLCYKFLNSATIGQKLFSIKVVDIKNNNKPSTFKIIIRSILVPLPLLTILLMLIFQVLNLINFHKFAPSKNFIVSILIKLISISNIYLILLFSVLFLLFWYNLYYITNRTTFCDIVSRTKVINYNKKDKINNNEIIRDFVYFGDIILKNLEKMNLFFFKLLKKLFNKK